MVTFRVHGRPIPQGSMKGFVRPGGRGGRPYVVLTSANTNTEPWRQEVAAAAIQAKVPHIGLGPVRITIVFHVPRPVSRPKKFAHPDKRPDLDKLLRAILDALTGIAFRDDGQVCEIRATKVYAKQLGASITVQPMGDTNGLVQHRPMHRATQRADLPLQQPVGQGAPGGAAVPKRRGRPRTRLVPD